MLLAGLLLSLLASPLPAPPPETEARLFQLVRDQGGLALETLVLREGETLVLATGGGQDAVAVLLPPVSPGTSGELLRAAEERTLVAALSAGQLVLSLAEGDRPGPELARVRPEELATLDVRVSAVDAAGAYRSWWLRGWTEPVEDLVGPSMDLFGGLLPLGEGDLVLTTEAYRRPPTDVVGEAALADLGLHVGLSSRAADGSEGWFLVDTSASGTVVAREFLPEDATIEEATMTERSAAGTRTLPAGMTGATGAVGGLLGEAALAELRLGELNFGPTTVRVLEELPSFGGRRVLGILGLDLLRRGGRVGLRWPRGETPGQLTLGAEQAPTGGDSLSLPMTLAAGLPFVKVEFCDRPVHCAVDSGSGFVFLARSAAARLELELDSQAGTTIRGLGAGSEAAPRVVAPGLDVAGQYFPDQPVYAADLPVFLRLAQGCDVGVLGLPLLRAFGSCALDFVAGELVLTP